MKTIFLSTALLFLFVSCKKYEEGPTLSLRSKKARLENNWKYEKIYKNNKEQYLSIEDQNYRLRLMDNGVLQIATSNGTVENTCPGTWALIEEDEKLTITIIYPAIWFISSQETKTYKILKLKNKELWIEELTSFGDFFEYHLMPE